MLGRVVQNCAQLTDLQFINDSSAEGMGLKLTWYTDPITISNGSTAAAPEDISNTNGSSDVLMSDGMDESTKLAAIAKRDIGEMDHGDLDVAEDDDRWMR
jgi:hypothetical protein